MNGEQRTGAALFVTTWLPQPTAQGTAMRAWQLLNLLRHRHAQVSVLLAPDTAVSQAQLDCLRAAQPKVTVQFVDAGLDAPTRRARTRAIMHGESWNLVLVFRAEAAYLVAGIPAGDAPWWLDMDELASYRERGIATLAKARGDAASAEYHRRLALAMMLVEKGQLERYQKIFFSSGREAARLADQGQACKLAVLPNIYRDVPALPPRPEPERRQCFRLLFVGALNYAPNHDAVEWLAQALAPAIRSRLDGGVELLVAGGSPQPELVKTMARAGIHYLGFVPDLSACYASADAVLVPLRHGTGTRIKILEAFALGRPVVSTSTGAEGLEVQPGQELLIADDPDAFAAAVLKLRDNPETAAALVNAALTFVRDQHSQMALHEAWDRTTNSS
ncbi:MAG: glycosyltransferase [Pseudomonadota bacterium]